MIFDRKWLVLFLAGILTLISTGTSISLSGGSSAIIEGADSVKGVTTPEGTDITATGSIQAAVNTAPTGATISLLPKTYYENVQVPKSLSIIGAGQDLTKVDGSGIGSVFTVGREENQNIDVTLSDMTIINGNADNGGINNAGTLDLKNVLITGNTGSGILNEGTVNMYTGSSIASNIADYAGGGILNEGTVNMYAGSSIAVNTAGNGGGVLNMGMVNMYTGSFIANNIADYGGGVLNVGTVTFTDSITGERVAYWPGYDTITDSYGFFTPHNNIGDIIQIQGISIYV